jgi:hypothetical protein
MFASKVPHSPFPQFEELQYWLAGETKFFVRYFTHFIDKRLLITANPAEDTCFSSTKRPSLGRIYQKILKEIYTAVGIHKITYN